MPTATSLRNVSQIASEAFQDTTQCRAEHSTFRVPVGHPACHAGAVWCGCPRHSRLMLIIGPLSGRDFAQSGSANATLFISRDESGAIFLNWIFRYFVNRWLYAAATTTRRDGLFVSDSMVPRRSFVFRANDKEAFSCVHGLFCCGDE